MTDEVKRRRYDASRRQAAAAERRARILEAASALFLGAGYGATTVGAIARRAGVSRSTVSYALSGRRTVSPETRRRIAQVIEEVGYRPNAAARALSVGRPHAARDLADLVERIGNGVAPVEVGPALAPRVAAALPGGAMPA